MATELRRLRLRRVSLVDSPANKSARVVLYKSAEATLDDCDICKAELEGESRGNLDDSDFAAVWTDSEGRKQRKLPIQDAAHVRNALARFNQTDMPAEVKAKAKAKLEAAKRKFGIGDDDKAEKMQPTSTEVNVDEMARCKKCDKSMKKGTKVCPECGAEMEPDADDMAKAADKHKEDAMDEKLKADLAAAKAEVESVTKERDELQKRLDAIDNTPEAIEKRKLEALPESVRKRIEEGEAKIAKLEAEKAENAEVANVRKAMPALPGKAEETGKLLKRVKDAVSKEDFEALSVLLKAASAQIEKGGLFREVGGSGDGPSDDKPLSKIDRLVSERISKSADKKLTYDQALQGLFTEQPDLYAEYARSVTADVNKRSTRDADAN